jgi:hypothetical protein
VDLRRASRRISFVVLVSVLAGCGPRVESFFIEGKVGRPQHVIGRDIGVSADIAGQVTWLFGDTVVNPASCAGTNLVDSTGAIDPPDAVVGNVTEPVDPCGAPLALVTPSVPNRPNGARTAFWPDSIVETLDGRAAVFYQRVLLDGDVWTVEATSVAEMDPGATTLDRSNETVLFGLDDRSYSSGNLVDGGFVYLYATELQPDNTTAYYLARVPLAVYRTREAYTFWNGSGWSTDIGAASKLILDGSGAEASGGLAGLTVSYNPHLGRYLMTHSQAFGQDLMLRTAAAPQGPWSSPTHIDVPDGSADNRFGNYSAREHPEFRSADGRTIYLTYERSTNALSAEMPVVRVVLK